MLTTNLRPVLLPTTDRFGEFIIENDWNKHNLVRLVVCTLSGNTYHWFFDGDTGAPAFQRNGQTAHTIRYATLPVWVNHDGGRAVLVEDDRDAAHFVRTSRVLTAEWTVRKGNLVSTHHLTLV